MKDFDYIDGLMQHEKSLLIARSSRVIRTFMTNQVENSDGGLTFMEWLVLGIVSRGPDKGLSMSQAASMIDVTLPQITAIANKLVEHKLVKQKVQAKDRRTRHMLVTNKGKSLIENHEKSITAAIRDWLYPNTDLTFDDLNKFFYVLDQMTTLNLQGKNGKSFVTLLKS